MLEKQNFGAYTQAGINSTAKLVNIGTPEASAKGSNDKAIIAAVLITQTETAGGVKFSVVQEKLVCHGFTFF